MTEAAASRIIVNAHRINAGHLPEPAAPDGPDGPDSDFHLIRVDTPEAIHERLL
jgi:exodeoxyribonuclease V alpha subunit